MGKKKKTKKSKKTAAADKPAKLSNKAYEKAVADFYARWYRFFLFRANNLPDAALEDQIGIIAAIEVDADRNPVENGRVERINYRSGLEGGIRVFGRDGCNPFADLLDVLGFGGQ